MTVEEGWGDRPLTQAGIAGPEFLHILSPISSLSLGPLISLVNQVPSSNFSWVLSINYDPQGPDLFLTSSGPLLTQPLRLDSFHFSEGPRLSSQPFPL